MAVMISMPNHNIHTRGSAILWEQRDYRSNANPSTEGGHRQCQSRSNGGFKLIDTREHFDF